MGLQRSIASQSLDISSLKLLRRIWWVLYTWDTLLTLNGMDMTRRRDTESHPPRLTEADWEEEVPVAFLERLHPVESTEKSYMIESCNLSIIIGKFWHSYASAPLNVCYAELDSALSAWRQTLPPGLQVSNITESTNLASWNLNLITRSYVCECIMFRMICRSSSSDHGTKECARQKLHSALFETNTTIDRIMNRNTGHFNTWLLHTCISTALALNIEKMFNPLTSSLEMCLSRLRIESMLEFLRDMAKTWPYINALVGMFQSVFSLTGILMPAGKVPESPRHLHSLWTSGLQHDNKTNEGDLDQAILGSQESPLCDLPFNPFNPNSLLDEVFQDNWQNLDFFNMSSK
ncbi:hypothetical protein BDV26DRAFT_288448 [Aspergillus bertholletiae]|uniref:Transcription factor domain-containing protein n=1 Tax=Aspergillus bertholletiae TaxID=1226010 RepID=A0A5N7BKU8_9EURO|nr:hypothetical protein BDV26DRAFT_288448 [Aspergillus bertholletiae]